MLVLRTNRPAFRSRPSRLLLWSTLAVLTLTFSIPYLGSLSRVFGFVPLSGGQLAGIVLILFGYIAATELAKAWFFRAKPPAQPMARVSGSEESPR